jgi:DNA-directed RNA polymerase subunit RPC12/RpoP
MYICHDCGKEFEVPMPDPCPVVDDWDTGAFDCCPNCGSDDINEVDPEVE